ncbi:MAG: BamA/TamA family outer membrane protein [Flavobacteriaceae bacterium]|nr:BamA/TamA family outer membrane protein [Flavobacteriaceae bacterium]
MKYVSEAEMLLVENNVYINGEVDSSIKTFVVQKTNQKSLGIPISLHVYNMGDKNHKKNYIKWKERHPKFLKLIAWLFSVKQSSRIGYLSEKYNNIFLKNGEAPIVWDKSKSDRTAKILQQHYFNLGYFDAIVTYDTIKKSDKKLKVNYYVDTYKPYIINNLLYDIESEKIADLYTRNIQASKVKKGEVFEYSNFKKEALRLTKLFRNSGIYHFSENLIEFVDIDTTSISNNTDVVIKISDRITQDKNNIETHTLRTQTVSSVDIITDYSFEKKGDKYKDSIINYNGFNFYAYDKINYRPKSLLRSIFVKPKELYSDTNRDDTKNQLKDLRNFDFINIKYQDQGVDSLKATILLNPTRKYFAKINTEISHSTIKELGISGQFSFTNTNALRGAEIFKVSLTGTSFNYFNSWEVGIDASITIPRFLAPFNFEKMKPKTRIALGRSWQKNIGLDKQKISLILDYNWKSKNAKHSFKLINLQYIENQKIDQYFDVYRSQYNVLNDDIVFYIAPTPELLDENDNILALPYIEYVLSADNDFKNTKREQYDQVLNIQRRYETLTQNYLIPSISYSFNYSSSDNFDDIDFYTFYANISSSGAVLNKVLSGIKERVKEGTNEEVFNVPIPQFLKIDFEYKRFWELNRSSSLAIRTFAGVAIPYNNSEIPFSKNYFIGGANDIRAWHTYDLGPGGSDENIEYNVGNIKLLANIEYRFNIVKSLKGALFIDAGNIWNAFGTSLYEDRSEFKGFNSMNEVAVASGFGLRYDMSFLIFRLDLAFKTHEPYLEGDKWLQNYNYTNALFQFGINYPF